MTVNYRANSFYVKTLLLVIPQSTYVNTNTVCHMLIRIHKHFTQMYTKWVVIHAEKAA